MRRHGWSLAIGATAGAALLVLLGVLQVRWLDQVAQTIAAQKRAALYRQGAAAATDLERELTRAFFWFHPQDEARTPPLAELLAERWRSWRQASPHPALLEAAWLIEPDAGGEPRARRLRGAGVLEEAAWPPALAEFRALLRGGFRVAGLLPTAAPESAWLALPPEPGEGPGEPAATVLLQIDGRHLAQVLLPALAAAHREPGGDAVVARLEDAGGQALFAAATGTQVFHAGEHDPIVILGMRPDLATPELLEGMRPTRRWPPEIRVHRVGPADRPPLPSRTLRASGVTVGFGAGPGLPPRASFAVQHRFGADRPVILHGPLRGPPGALGPPGHWRLALSYAAGPVDGVVTSLRRRNLALGFSALTLLGGAIGALSLAVRRAQGLAEQRRQFMASVSHELRTPLAVIGSAAENLRDGTVEDPARVREYGTIIHTESKRLAAMMDHTLRLAAGKDLAEDLALEELDVRAVVDAAVDSFSSELRGRAGEIERDLPALPCLVWADREALRQAVENVVGNALKYGGESPRVTVRVSRIEAPAGPEVQVTVEDQGMGIASDEVAQVFEPFFRGRDALARQIRGTGLGLALVARVMRAHRGGVSVQSAPGRGSIFVLWLPAAGGPET